MHLKILYSIVDELNLYLTYQCAKFNKLSGVSWYLIVIDIFLLCQRFRTKEILPYHFRFGFKKYSKYSDAHTFPFNDILGSVCKTLGYNSS